MATSGEKSFRPAVVLYRGIRLLPTLRSFGLGIVLGMAIASPVPAGEQAPTQTAILSTEGQWRYFIVMRDTVYGTAKDAKPMEDKRGYTYRTDPPPAGWTEPDFDDSDWGRRPGPFFPGYGFHQQDTLGMLCLRDSFFAPDPEKAPDLSLSAVYRGGIAVYLNGREIARKNLPDGELTADSLAEDYPADCWMKPDGGAIRWGWGDPEKNKDRCEMRIRRLEDVKVPAKLLRKGTNVLAVAVFRSAVSGELPKAKNWWEGRWNTAGLLSLKLCAPPGAAGVTPNVGKPKGVWVWNANPMAPVGEKDFADPAVPVRPIRIVGARNGSFSGQVIVGGEGPVKGIRAAIGNLDRKGGGGAIPASAVQVRYAVLDGSHGCFDTLSDSPPEESRQKPVQPVWVTVKVPADAPAGDYEGRLTVSAEGLPPAEVPVRLKVCDWTLPPPRDYVTFADFVDSPESVAMHYNVPLWSDEHFRLMGRTFEQLGRIGNKTVYIHLMCRSNHGNSQTMVRWIKDGDGYKHDFSIMERYLDLYIEKAGKPRFVIFYVWEKWTGGGYFGRKDDNVKGVPVTLYDPEKKEASQMDGPAYNSPEAVAFWKPVADGIRERLKKRGLEDGWVLGVAFDCKPAKEPVDVWKAVAPEARWSHQGHGLDKAYYGVPLAYNTSVWNCRFAPDPSKGRLYGWQRDKPVVCQFHRDISKSAPYLQLLESRITAEKNITGEQNGFGRMSATFWPVLKDPKGRTGRTIAARYPESSWAQCDIFMTAYLSPGPDGARSTIRYEMVVEGIQECEARIAIEKALLADKGHNKLLAAGEAPADTAARLQAILDARTRAHICASGDLGSLWYSCSGWQDRSAALFSAAGEVAAMLGSGSRSGSSK